MLGEAVGDMNCRVQNSGVIDERGWGTTEVGQWIPPIANYVLQPPDEGLHPRVRCGNCSILNELVNV